MSDTSL